MTEHEKLKEICDKIGYYDYIKDYTYIETVKKFMYVSKFLDDAQAYINIREIIFTQEFMDKFHKYYFRDDNDESVDLYYQQRIYDNLDNIVKYLYQLIK